MERKKLFDEYFESSYKHGNILTNQQLEISSKYFERDYKSFMPEDKNAKILDFGCGTGDFLYHLKKKGYQNFFGIDISASQIEYCKKNITDQAQTMDGIDFLKDKKETFDLIVAHDVMEHIPKNEIIKFLTLIHQALKKGGQVVIRVPNMSNPFGLDARFNDFTHEIGFTSKSLYQVLWLAEFRHIQILPIREIPIRSLRNWVRKIFVKCLHNFMRFCFYIQDYSVPQNLDKNLVALAKKS
jgi:2-polyprenyl-3-methyl-5-hydroxy-6-metoxy-1,4-benzoquinol methylase